MACLGKLLVILKNAGVTLDMNGSAFSQTT